MMPKRLCLVLPLFLGWGPLTVSGASSIPETFRCTWEKSGRVPFSISKDGKMLEIPDLIYYRVKRDELVMDVVQGLEKNRFEPITTYIVHVAGKDTPEGRLEALATVYDRAFAQARRFRCRDDDQESRPADGFSVSEFRRLPTGPYEAAVTLYDYSDDFRTQLLKSIRDLTVSVQTKYDAIAKYDADLTKATAAYVDALSAMQEQLADINRNFGRLRHVRERLIKIDESLEAALEIFMQGTKKDMERMRREFKAGDQALRRQLQYIRDDLKRLEKAQ